MSDNLRNEELIRQISKSLAMAEDGGTRLQASSRKVVLPIVELEEESKEEQKSSGKSLVTFKPP
jgi:hypothetical protein